VTSVGQRRSEIWMRDASGERAVSIEGIALAPKLSIDGRRLYYLLQRDSRDATFIELRTLDLSTGKTDRPLPDRSVWQYDVSPDEREVAFTTRSANGAREIWLATLDRSVPPRRLTDGRWLYVTLLGIGEQPGSTARNLAVRMGDNGELPTSLRAVVDAAFAGTLPPDQPGVRLLQGAFIAPGPDPSTYAYLKQEVQSNLFRIPIR